MVAWERGGVTIHLQLMGAILDKMAGSHSYQKMKPGRLTKDADWLLRRGFHLVLDHLGGGGFVEIFDCNREYQFMRPEWDEPQSFRMVDQHQFYNIMGLWFRSTGEGAMPIDAKDENALPAICDTALAALAKEIYPLDGVGPHTRYQRQIVHELCERLVGSK